MGISPLESPRLCRLINYELHEYLRLPTFGLQLLQRGDGIDLLRQHVLPEGESADAGVARSGELKWYLLDGKHDVAFGLMHDFPDVLHARASTWGEPPLPIYWAICNDAFALFLLLRARAEPGVQDGDMTSPLVYAVLQSSVVAVQLLLTAAACPNQASGTGQAPSRTPLFTAVSMVDYAVTHLLLAAKADPARDAGTLTALVQRAVLPGLPAVLLRAAKARLARPDRVEVAKALLPYLLAEGDWAGILMLRIFCH